jgi:hypothetical protein
LEFLQQCLATATSAIASGPDAQTCAQKLAGLQEIVAAWPKLALPLRAAMKALTRAVSGET